MADGQVYVTVRADASTYSARSVESGGSTSTSGRISWSFDGGISGQYGWTTGGRVVEFVDGDIAATNDAVARAWAGASLRELLQIENCWSPN